MGHEIHVHTKQTNLAYHFGHACRSVIHAEFFHHKIYADFSITYVTRPKSSAVDIFNLDMPWSVSVHTPGANTYGGQIVTD